MMQLEEITPPDPRLAGWNADDAPVAMRCLACAVEPKQASSLIRELHDALPANMGGVAHVKRVKKGDDGKLRVVLAAEAVYDDVSREEAYQALSKRRPELAREALEVVSVRRNHRSHGRILSKARGSGPSRGRQHRIGPRRRRTTTSFIRRANGSRRRNAIGSSSQVCAHPVRLQSARAAAPCSTTL